MQAIIQFLDLLKQRYYIVIFNRHPPLPSYSNIWDINYILSYYHKLAYNNELKFSNLCKKVVALLLTFEARTKQAIMTITVDGVILYDDKVVLLSNKTLKHSVPHHPLEPFVYKKYVHNEKLCIVNCTRF